MPAVAAESPEDAKLADYSKFISTYGCPAAARCHAPRQSHFDDVLKTSRAQSRAEWEKLVRTTLSDLPKKVDYQKLSARFRRSNFEILQAEPRAAAVGVGNIKPFETDPRPTAITHEQRIVLLTQSTQPREKT